MQMMERETYTCNAQAKAPDSILTSLQQSRMTFPTPLFVTLPPNWQAVIKAGVNVK